MSRKNRPFDRPARDPSQSVSARHADGMPGGPPSLDGTPPMGGALGMGDYTGTLNGPGMRPGPGMMPGGAGALGGAVDPSQPSSFDSPSFGGGPAMQAPPSMEELAMLMAMQGGYQPPDTFGGFGAVGSGAPGGLAGPGGAPDGPSGAPVQPLIGGSEQLDPRDAQRIDVSYEVPIIDSPNYATDPEIAKRALARVKDTLLAAQAERANLERRWLRFYRLYRSVSTDRSYKGRANLFVPKTYSTLRKVLPRLAQRLFGEDNWFAMQPRDPSDKNRVEACEALLLSQQRRRGFKPVVKRGLKSCGLYGTMVGKLLWEKWTRNVKRRVVNQLPAAGGARTVPQVSFVDDVETVFEGPTYRGVDLFNVYLHPLTADRIEELDAVIERVERTEAELRAMAALGIYVNVDDFCRGAGSINTGRIMEREATAGLGIVGSIQKAHKKFAIHEYWGRFSLPSTKPDGTMAMEECECVIAIGEQRSVLRVQRNPFWHGRKPYVMARWDSIDGEIYGIGAVEPLAKLQLEVNDTRNQTMDARTFALNPVLVTSDSSGLKEQDLALYPGRNIRTTDISQVKPLAMPDVTNTGLEGEKRARDDMDEVAGLNEIMTGQGSVNRTPGTTVSAMIDEGSLPINDVADNIWNEFLIPLLEMSWQLNEQFITEPQVVRAIGKGGMDWLTVDPADVVGSYDFKLLGKDQIATRMSQGQQLINFLRDAAPYIQQQPGLVDVGECLKRVLRGIGQENVEALVPDNAPSLGRDPNEENMAFIEGVALDPQPNDDFHTHLAVHQQLMMAPEFQEQGSPIAKQCVQEHMQATLALLAQVEAQQAAQKQGGGQNSGTPRSPSDTGPVAASRENGQILGGSPR